MIWRLVFFVSRFRIPSHRDSDLHGRNSFFSELTVESIIGLFAFPSRGGHSAHSRRRHPFVFPHVRHPSRRRWDKSVRAFCSRRLSLGYTLLSRYFIRERLSFTFTRETGDCVADDARRASPIKRAGVERGGGGGMAGSSLPTFPLRFFSLVTFDSPTFALAMPPRRGRATSEREKVGTLICRAFCARENARRVLIAAWLSRTIYSPIRWKRIYHSFPFAFFPSPLLFPLSFSLSPLTDSACTARERSHTNLHENVANSL